MSLFNKFNYYKNSDTNLLNWYNIELIKQRLSYEILDTNSINYKTVNLDPSNIKYYTYSYIILLLLILIYLIYVYYI